MRTNNGQLFLMLYDDLQSAVQYKLYQPLLASLRSAICIRKLRAIV